MDLLPLSARPVRAPDRPVVPLPLTACCRWEQYQPGHRRKALHCYLGSSAFLLRLHRRHRRSVETRPHYYEHCARYDSRYRRFHCLLHTSRDPNCESYKEMIE